MAALTKSAVTLNTYWMEGPFPGSRRKLVDATIVPTAQGSIANPIPATLFNLSKITSVRTATGSDNKNYVAGPSYDGLNLTFGAGVPADINATVHVIVEGLE